jgi:hypothetical protein
VVNISVASEEYPDLFCATSQTQSQQNQARLDQGGKHAALHHCSRALTGLAVTDGPSQSLSHPRKRTPQTPDACSRQGHAGLRFQSSSVVGPCKKSFYNFLAQFECLHMGVHDTVVYIHRTDPPWQPLQPHNKDLLLCCHLLGCPRATLNIKYSGCWFGWWPMADSDLF